MAEKSFRALEIFFSYSHRDEKLREELGKHIEVLKQLNIVSDWHDRKITAGTEWQGEIDEHLDSAHVILLLVSVDFLYSGYIKDVELKRAMERHDAGEARVIPVILRKCTWEKASFGKLQALPANARPVTLWPNRDVAFTEVATGIGLVIEELRQKPAESARKRRKAQGVRKHGAEFKSDSHSSDALRRSADSGLSHEEMEKLVEEAVRRAQRVVPDNHLRSKICQEAKVLLKQNDGESLSKEQLEQLDERFLRKREKRKTPDPKKIRWVLRAARLHPQGRRIAIRRKSARLSSVL